MIRNFGNAIEELDNEKRKSNEGKNKDKGQHSNTLMPLAEEASSLKNDDVENSASLPIQYCVLACAATAYGGIEKLRSLAGLAPLNDVVDFKVPTFHIIGVDDPYRPQSEEFTTLFANRKVLYVAGEHGVSGNHRNDLTLRADLRRFIESRGTETEVSAPTDVKSLTEISVSEVSSILVDSKRQVCTVKIDPTSFPTESEGGPQIQTFLRKFSDNPFLKSARDASEVTTSYGDILSFCRGGDGDLRRIGVKSSEEVVAYYAHGSGAVAACAFLTVASQAAAVPFGPMTTEEALYALVQFRPSHLILFEGMEDPGVTSAFQKYAKSGRGTLHWAEYITSTKPGLFTFPTSSQDEVSDDPLRNNGVSLLLRNFGYYVAAKGSATTTSGTCEERLHAGCWYWTSRVRFLLFNHAIAPYWRDFGFGPCHACFGRMLGL